MLVSAQVNLPGLRAGEVTDVDGNDAHVRRLVAGGHLRKASAAETAAYKERHGVMDTIATQPETPEDLGRSEAAEKARKA